MHSQSTILIITVFMIFLSPIVFGYLKQSVSKMEVIEKNLTVDGLVEEYYADILIGIKNQLDRVRVREYLIQRVEESGNRKTSLEVLYD